MRLHGLHLNEFRSFRELALDIDPAGFRAVGPNASGKSTLLEAVAMLATTRSSRTAAEREIPHWQSGLDLAVPPYTRLRGDFQRLDGPHHIEIGLEVENREQGASKKQIRFDDRPVRAIDAVGQLKTVLFSPEDVNLVAGPPSIRRRFLDLAASQASRSYLRALSRFNRVLEQRNSLLRRFAKERIGADSSRTAQELAFWNSELTATATDVVSIRLGAVDYLSSHARSHYQSLTGDDSLEVTYLSPRVEIYDWRQSDNAWQEPSQPMRQTLAAAFAASLTLVAAEEIRRGVTVLGPHRDDLAVSANGIELGRFGSRGQQRLAVLAIKLAELDLLEDAAGEPPILLLDDVLSELDIRHREKLIHVLSIRNAQICLTSTEDGAEAAEGLRHLPLVRTGTCLSGESRAHS